MTPLRDQLPWAAPATHFRENGEVVRYPAGYRPSAHDAREMLGERFDPAAEYISDGRYVRRAVSTDNARAMGLRWAFSGECCPNGHISPRKLRDGSRGSECAACLASKKRRRAA